MPNSGMATSLRSFPCSTTQRAARSFVAAQSIFRPYSTWLKSSVEAMKEPGAWARGAVFVVKELPTGEKTTVWILLSIALAAVGQACSCRSSSTTSRPSAVAAWHSASQASASSGL